MQAVIGGMTVVAGLALTTLASRPTPDNPPVADEKKVISSLEGSYTITSGERAGKAIPEAELKGGVVRFADGKIVGTDKDRKEFFVATYTLDVTKKPWKIDMKTTAPAKAGEPAKELAATGLVKKEGDTVTVIYALPGGEAPTEFKAKDKQQMFVMKPITPEKLPNKFQPAVPEKP